MDDIECPICKRSDRIEEVLAEKKWKWYCSRCDVQFDFDGVLRGIPEKEE